MYAVTILLCMVTWRDGRWAEHGINNGGARNGGGIIMKIKAAASA